MWTLDERRRTRREILRTGALGAAGLLLGCGAQAQPRVRDPREPLATDEPDAGAPPTDAGTTTSAADAGLEPTAQCEETEDNIEGPFYLPGAPVRSVLADPSLSGTRLALTGRVLDVGCRPLPGATLDVWQADARGAYDEEGYRLRGKLTTDAEGRFSLTTIIPGRYLNGRQYRPAHLHVKAAAPGTRMLTTQLYFEGDPYNGVDPFIRRSLVMPLRETGDGRAATFDFVLAPA